MAIAIFIEAATQHAQATETGDYKVGNKWWKKIIESIVFLRNKNALPMLIDLLSHPSVGVRLWSATYLLTTNEKEAIKVLENAQSYPGIHSLTAETVLSEWRKGKLKLL